MALCYFSVPLSRTGQIDGIGDGRKVTLRSFGVETAWDIRPNIIKTVPGFGPVLTGKLTAWRSSVESQFKFNPNIPIDPADIAKIRSEIAIRRSALETGFINGIRELETIRIEALAKRNNTSQYHAAYLAFQQATIDTKHLSARF